MKISEKLLTILLTIAATLAVEAVVVSLLCGFGVIHIGWGREPQKEETVISQSDVSKSDVSKTDVSSDDLTSSDDNDGGANGDWTGWY